MTSLAAAVIFLLVTHFSSSTPLRPWAVARWGEGPWLGLYSLVSLGAFAWLVAAYRAAPTVWITAPVPGAGHLLLVLVPVAAILMIAANASPNAASLGQHGAMTREPVGILRVTRHPMLWGVGLWALGHLAANPDVASAWLFGGLAALSFGGMVAQEVKKRRDAPEGWAAYAARTSVVPFAAVVAGRGRLALDGGLLWQVPAGLAVAAGLYVAHPWLIGVPAGPF